MYSGYRITFDSAGSWDFDNDIARNVIIFDVNNSSSSHADNDNNNVLVLGERPTFRINGRVGSPERNFNISFSKASTKFCLSLHLSLQMEKKYLNLKATIKMLTFQLNLVLEVFLMDLILLSQEKYP